MNAFETPFKSIESAHEFLKLLVETVNDTRRDVELDLQSGANDKLSRRVEALRLVAYKLEKLEHHVKASGRLLNDLRMLQRVLLEEKIAIAASAAK